MTRPESSPRSRCAMIPIGMMAALLATGACASTRPPPSQPPPGVAQPATERLGSTMMQPRDQGTSAAPSIAASSTEHAHASGAELAALDDAQLAAVIWEANDQTTRIARVGVKRVTGRGAHRLARDLATSNLDMRNKLQARLSQLGIEPASSTVSDQVRADIGGNLASLPSSDSKDFDRAYVDAQLRALIRAAELVDGVVGRVENLELRETIEDMRARLSIDIRMARAARETMER